MIAPHLRGGGFHVPLEVVQPTLTTCGIEVVDAALLRARCPAEDLHTTANKPGECVIFPNNALPQICCHHTSCKEQVEAINRQLRDFSRSKGYTTPPSLNGGFRQSQSQVRHREYQSLQHHAARVLPLILEKFHWPVSAIVAASPTPVSLPVPHHHRYIFDLFEDTDIVWTGDRVNQTGSPWHAVRFRTVKHWLNRTRCPGVFICPNTLAPGTYSRSGGNVVARKFLVVESDRLNRNQVGAVYFDRLGRSDGHVARPARACPFHARCCALFAVGQPRAHGPGRVAPQGRRA